jgi:hypothetical protein
VRKHVAAFILLFVALWFLWHLFAGEWNRYEWIAATSTSAVAAAIGAIAIDRTNARARFPFAIVRSIPSALAMVFVDFATVMRCLLTRREGVVRRTRFEYPDDVPHRAWAMIVADYSANAYVIDISDGESLTHHLVPRKKSQEPA